MKILILLLFTLSNIGHIDPQLIIGKWSLKKVLNEDLNEFAAESINKGMTWNFKNDKTMIYEINNDFFNRIDSGHWDIIVNELIILQNSDTFRVKIEKLTETQFTWVMEEEHKLIFELEKVLE